MAYETGTATGYLDALTRLKNFVTNPNDVSAAVADPGNTGNGTCSQPTAVDSAPTETWTLTATSATVFTVTGSISGGKADANVGTPYNNGIVAFEITAGGTPFVSGDEFTFTVTMVMGTEHWTCLEWDTDFDGNGNYYCVLQAPGSSDDQEIFVGIQTTHDDTEPYYNWLLNGYTGYHVSQDFYTQQGARSGGSSLIPRVNLDDGSMKYWFMANGRRVFGVLRIGTVYAQFYLGLFLPYGTPNQYPYPLFIGGSNAYNSEPATRQFSSTYAYHRAFWDPFSTGESTACSAMILNGVWISVGNYYSNGESYDRREMNIWPYIYAEHHQYEEYPNRFMWYGDPTPDGAHPLFPCVLAQNCLGVANILGELHGVLAVHGDGVVAEDEISYGGKAYKVFPNVFRTGAADYCAMLLE